MIWDVAFLRHRLPSHLAALRLGGVLREMTGRAPVLHQSSMMRWPQKRTSASSWDRKGSSHGWGTQRSCDHGYAGSDWSAGQGVPYKRQRRDVVPRGHHKFAVGARARATWRRRTSRARLTRCCTVQEVVTLAQCTLPTSATCAGVPTRRTVPSRTSKCFTEKRTDRTGCACAKEHDHNVVTYFVDEHGRKVDGFERAKNHKGEEEPAED